MVSSALEDRYLIDQGRVYLTGIQALVRMLLDRARHDRGTGRRTDIYVSGYEGSPLAGYDLELGRRRDLLAQHRIRHQPGLNEELAATAVSGTQLAAGVAPLRADGVTGFWYGKAPGLDRATDAIRHANLIGTTPAGGAVALVGDDPTAKSSTFPSASESALADLELPTLYPADVSEILEHGLHAVEISRASGLWTAMKIATNVADGANSVALPEFRPPDLSELAAYQHKPNAKLVGPVLAALEQDLVEQRLPVALEYIRRAGLNRISGAADARIGIVAAGKTFLDVRQALTKLGLSDAALERYGIRLLKLGLTWPLEPSVVREFATGLREIVTVEDKRSFLETAIKDVLYGTPEAPAVFGKQGPAGARLFPAVGELDPDQVMTGLATVLRRFDDIEPVRRQHPARRERIELPLAARTPYFCSGCPHNSATKVPEGMLVGGGIGCHAMVVLMPEEQAGTVTGLCQMGGEGAQWIGIAPHVDAPHFVQNIGDGTFAHSGSLAVRAAVASGVDITYKLLYNSAVAMTGGQDAVGGMPVARIAALLLVEGAKRVVITTEDPRRVRRSLRALPGRFSGISVRHRDDLVAVQEELSQVSGVTVLIHDQECAAQRRRKRKRGKAATPAERIVINERVCEGCGDCARKSNCLSVQPVDTEFGRKTRIDQSSCNLDASCLSGDCPSFVTVVPGTQPEKPTVSAGTSMVPEPEQRFDGDGFAMRITGIGGTGVVTIAQILATAAALDGRRVRSLDQTGLAQKGGAVVSDLKLGEQQAAAKLAEGECDLYLGCDSLVATDPVQLKCVDPLRTVAVVSTAEVPTGGMVRDPAAGFPAAGQVRERLDSAVTVAHYVDADRIAVTELGSGQFTNMVLVGAAYQAGALPISAAAIEEAIGINGVSVSANRKAFQLGRQAVAEPSSQATDSADEPGELARLLAVRVADLTAYQHPRYAADYVEFVEQVRAAEAAAVPGETRLAESVARNLHKLMAYKDEYEVARLCLDPEFQASLTERFGAGSKMKFRLHPPVLRAMGMRRKIALGAWARPAFHLLRAMRRLRGTRLDPFGGTEVRRTERELITEYRTMVTDLLGELAADNHQLAVEIAELPELIRGYEDIKLGNVGEFRARYRELNAKLREPQQVS